LSLGRELLGVGQFTDLQQALQRCMWKLLLDSLVTIKVDSKNNEEIFYFSLSITLHDILENNGNVAQLWLI
jgi:hypothetical protein